MEAVYLCCNKTVSVLSDLTMTLRFAPLINHFSNFSFFIECAGTW